MYKIQLARLTKLRNFYTNNPELIDEDKNRYQDILPYPYTMMVRNFYFNGNKIKLTDNISVYMC